ncbi:hypothetical protein Mapa_007163 [Marchantia paleacea]|nr:hypothetical protein Mapa_007163 [Marchantia paleacea]
MARMKMGRLSWGLWLQAVVLFFSLGVSAAAPKRVDVHSHFVPPFYAKMIKARNLTSGGAQVPEWNETMHLEIMAKYNVETSILSVSPPSVTFFSHDEAAERRSLARRLNEYAHNLSMRYAGKFQFAATLTLPDVEGAVAEAVYALDSLNAAAVLLLGNSNGMYLGNPKLDPLMEVLDARSAVVLLHPNVLPGDETGVPAAVLDFLLDTTRAATNLVVKNVTRKYPNIKYVLSHSGGFIPYASGRMSLLFSEILPNTTQEDFTRLLKTFYIDFGYVGKSTIPSALDFVPHDQIVFGSDWPAQPKGLEYVSGVVDSALKNGKLKYDINYGNAAKLFKLS